MYFLKMFLLARHKNKAFYLLRHETTANKQRLYFIADKSQGLLCRAWCCELYLRVCVPVHLSVAADCWALGQQSQRVCLFFG